jgi:hypothetical protein
VTRRSRTILDDLALLPWWINVIPATLAYLSFKYWFPSASFQNPLYKGISPLVGGLILFVATVSAFNALQKGDLLERQTGGGE